MRRSSRGAAFRDALARLRAQFTPPHRASQAVGHIKRAVQSGLEMSLADGLALERELQQRLFESDDAREGMRRIWTSARQLHGPVDLVPFQR